MPTDPRAALDRLVGALEAHLTAAQRRRGEADPAVEAAYKALADAFEDYDEALYGAHDEVTPFVLYDDVEDDRYDDDPDGDDEFDDDELDIDLVETGGEVPAAATPTGGGGASERERRPSRL